MLSLYRPRCSSLATRPLPGPRALPAPCQSERRLLLSKRSALPPTLAVPTAFSAALASLSSAPLLQVLAVQLSLLSIATRAGLSLVAWASAHEPADEPVSREPTELEAALALPPGSTGRLFHAHLSAPARLLLKSSALCLGAMLCLRAFSAQPLLLSLLLALWRSLAVFCASWAAVCAVQIAFSHLSAQHPALRATLETLRVLCERFVAGVGLLYALHALGAPMGPVLALGSVGGISLGLASQVAAGNLVAGACLLLARPFAVHEKIEVRRRRERAKGLLFHTTLLAFSCQVPGLNVIGWVTRFGLDVTEIVQEARLRQHTYAPPLLMPSPGTGQHADPAAKCGAREAANHKQEPADALPHRGHLPTPLRLALRHAADDCGHGELPAQPPGLCRGAAAAQLPRGAG